MAWLESCCGELKLWCCCCRKPDNVILGERQAAEEGERKDQWCDYSEPAQQIKLSRRCTDKHICSVILVCLALIIGAGVLFPLLYRVNYFAVFLSVVVVSGVVMFITFVWLVFLTTETSISGMIAQRFHKHSYFLIISCTIFSTLIAACVILAAVVRKVENEPNQDWVVLLAAFCPFTCEFLLVFPIVVSRPSRLLHFLPDKRRYPMSQFVILKKVGKKYHIYDDKNVQLKINGNMLVFPKENEAFTEEQLPKAIFQQLNGDGLGVSEMDPFYEHKPGNTLENTKCSAHIGYKVHLLLEDECWSSTLHLLSIAIGAIMGYISCLVYVVHAFEVDDRLSRSKAAIAVSIMVPISFVCLIGYAIGNCCHLDGRYSTVAEGCGLMLLYLSILVVAIVNGDLLARA